MPDATWITEATSYNFTVTVSGDGVPPQVVVGTVARPQVNVTVSTGPDLSNVGTFPGSGQAFAYVHTQTAPASEWTAVHGWGVPAASIQLEIAGQVWLPDVIETNAQHVVIAFPSPEVGVIRLVRGI